MIELLILMVGYWTAAAHDAAQQEAEMLQGTWIVVNDGSFRKGEKWVITGGQLQVDRDKVLRLVTLQPRAMPQGIDITIMAQQDGPAVAFLKGIYYLNGNRLQVYLVGPGQDRPAAFPPRGDLSPVLILHRQQP